MLTKVKCYQMLTKVITNIFQNPQQTIHCLQRIWQKRTLAAWTNQQLFIGMDFFTYGRNCCHFCWSAHMRRKFEDILDHHLFLILKSSHKDLSNERSNFILSLLEVGHWVAQTQLIEITDFGFLQQSQNRVKFWICSVLT